MILSKIHSQFCFKILLEYINEELKFNIFKYSKLYQKKLGLSINEYIKKNIDLKYENLLIQRNDSYNNGKKSLYKKYDDIILKYQHIDKKILDKIIYEIILNELSLVQKKKYPHSIKEIQVYSPFFNQLSEQDIINNLYIYIPLENIEPQLICEINNILTKYNQLNFQSIFLNGKYSMLKQTLSKININFTIIKNLEIEFNDIIIDLSHFNFSIFSKNLVSLKLDFHSRLLKLDSNLCIINTLSSLKNLALCSVIFNNNFLLSIKVENLYLRDCLNFGFESNKVLTSLKTLEIIRGKIINKFKYELPNVEKLIFNVDLDLNYKKFGKLSDLTCTTFYFLKFNKIPLRSLIILDDTIINLYKSENKNNNDNNNDNNNNDINNNNDNNNNLNDNNNINSENYNFSMYVNDLLEKHKNLKIKKNNDNNSDDSDNNNNNYNLSNKKLLNDEEELINKILSNKLLEKVNVTIQQISKNFDISNITEKNDNLKEIICYIRTWNYNNKIDTYDLIQNILNLNKISFSIMNFENISNNLPYKIIIKEFPKCEITNIKLDLNYCKHLDIVFYCKSFSDLQSLSFKNTYISSDTFPLFNKNQKIYFYSLKIFSLICEKNYLFDIINNLYQNLDYCPSLKIFELIIIDNNITEYFYNLFIQKLLSLNFIKQIILKIFKKEEDINKNYDIYTQKELEEKYPSLFEKKKNKYLNLYIMKFPKN